MPDIRLQDYTAKIKDLIRNARLDEAIAHCQHILRHYPKHIETYCLLGEACLENQMYRESIEFFQRTLGADPENLMARVGLGVIYDEQGATPEAIWQLERAFELVPGNAEVRRELLRLYGQYEAIDKTRLNLTRGALGRLYSRNGLYDRAISEFRAVLRQDPDLPDIRVALIEVLWCEDRQVEAVEMCLDLLDALPHCLKANLILGEIWLHGGNEESANQRLSVARALDPENRVAQELMGNDSPLPPEEVLIPELESIPDAFDFAPEIATVAEAVVGEGGEEADTGEQEPWGTDEELPDWLRDVGVTAEVEPSLEMPVEEEDLAPSPDEAIPAEEMPEWLQEVMGEDGYAPAGEPSSIEAPLDEEMAEKEESSEPLPLLGLSEVVGEVAGATAMGPWEESDQEPPAPEVPAEEMPEWLEALLGEAGSVVGDRTPPAGEISVSTVSEVKEEIPILGEDALPAQEEGPEWTPDLEPEGEEVAAPPVSEIEEESLTPEEGPLAIQEVPGWLRDLDTSEVEEVAAPPVEQPVEIEEETPALEEEAWSEDEVPDWLRDLGVADFQEVDEAETEVVAAPPVIIEPEAEDLAVAPAAGAQEEIPSLELEALPDDEIPDWLRDLGVADLEDVAEAETEVIPALPDIETETEDLAGALAAEAEEQIPTPEEDVLPEDEIPDWLRDLGVADEEQVPEAEPEALAVPPVDESEESPSVVEEVPLIDEIPDWLRDLDLPDGEVAAHPAAEVAETQIPASLKALVAAGLLDEADLESAMAEMSEEELAAQRAEEVPSWLSELIEEEPPEPAVEAVAPEVEELEPVVEEAALEVEEPEPLIEAAVPEAEEPEPVVEEAVPEVEELEPLIEEAVPEAEEPEPVAEEAALETEEPEPVVEEAVPEVEELEPLIEEAVPEAEGPEPIVEEAALEVEEPELLVEEAAPEAEEPEPVVEEAALEVEEPELLVEEAAPEAEEPEPIVEEAALEVEEPEPVVEEAVPEAEEPEIALSSRGDELLSQLKTRPRDYGARLELARLRYTEKDWDAALVNYQKLISARRFLPEVIDDLESLLEKRIEQARVYHMLGDAYMQQDRLDEALDMYRLARKKLAKH